MGRNFTSTSCKQTAASHICHQIGGNTSSAFGIWGYQRALPSSCGIRKKSFFTATWKDVILWGLADKKCKLMNMICYHSHHAAQTGTPQVQNAFQVCNRNRFYPMAGEWQIPELLRGLETSLSKGFWYSCKEMSHFGERKGFMVHFFFGLVFFLSILWATLYEHQFTI